MNQPILTTLEAFFSDCPTKSYDRGDTIIMSHRDPPGILWLIDGIVEQYDITPEGNKVTVNVFKPGAYFPMSWAINKTPNGYFYGALTGVKLRQADADKTVAFVKSHPEIMFDLLSRVYKGTDALLKRLVLAASGMAANRLIFELLIEAYRFGEEKDGVRIITITQSALAARSGLARETVSRELQKLEKENLIERTKQEIRVNSKKLEEKLDFSV